VGGGGGGGGAGVLFLVLVLVPPPLKDLLHHGIPLRLLFIHPSHSLALLAPSFPHGLPFLPCLLPPPPPSRPSLPWAQGAAEAATHVDNLGLTRQEDQNPARWELPMNLADLVTREQGGGEGGREDRRGK
jgi:hypothetical protein